MPEILVTSTFNKHLDPNHLNMIFEAKLSFEGVTGSYKEIKFETIIFLDCAARPEFELVIPFE